MSRYAGYENRGGVDRLAARKPRFADAREAAHKPVASRRQFSDLERGALRDGSLDFAAYQSEVRENLIRMAKRFDWVVVTPGDRTVDEVAEELADLIAARVGE